jgi:dipeptidase E
MKFLLTSAGFTNEQIVNSLQGLAGKELSQLSCAFIPTAGLAESGNKDWLINDLVACQNLFGSIDIVDISNLPQVKWHPRLEAADVLVIGGGETFYLLEQATQSGLAELLPDLLQQRVYVGISAGSLLVTQDLSFSDITQLYGESIEQAPAEHGLGLVKCNLWPHLNSPYFKVTEECLHPSPNNSVPTFLLDDSSALVINEDGIQVVSTGMWRQIG